MMLNEELNSLTKFSKKNNNKKKKINKKKMKIMKIK